MRRLPRAEYLLPIVIVLGAIVLFAAEFTVAFEFTPPGGEPLREQTNLDRHSGAMLVLAVAILLALWVALSQSSRPASFAVAGLGAATLLIFLVFDLPDAGRVGDLEDPLRGIATAEARPQAGFWLQAVGAAALAFGGGALATLTPAELRAPLAALRRRRKRPARDEPPNEPRP